MSTERNMVNDREWLAERLAEGLSYNEIARLAGCSKPRVAQCIAKFGLVRNPRATEGTRLMTNRCLADPNWLWAYVESGWTLERIAQAAGAIPHTVLVWINRHGFHDAWKRAKKREAAEAAAKRAEEWAAEHAPKYPPLRDIDALSAAVNERGAAAVAREIGCHTASVMRALERAGVPRTKFTGRRGRRPVNGDRDALIVGLVREGVTRTEIARRMGISVSRVATIAADAGFPGKPGRPRKRGNTLDKPGTV